MLYYSIGIIPLVFDIFFFHFYFLFPQSTAECCTHSAVRLFFGFFEIPQRIMKCFREHLFPPCFAEMLGNKPIITCAFVFA